MGVPTTTPMTPHAVVLAPASTIARCHPFCTAHCSPSDSDSDSESDGGLLVKTEEAAPPFRTVEEIADLFYNTSIPRTALLARLKGISIHSLPDYPTLLVHTPVHAPSPLFCEPDSNESDGGIYIGNGPSGVGGEGHTTTILRDRPQQPISTPVGTQSPIFYEPDSDESDGGVFTGNGSCGARGEGDKTTNLAVVTASEAIGRRDDDLNQRVGVSDRDAWIAAEHVPAYDIVEDSGYEAGDEDVPRRRRRVVNDGESGYDSGDQYDEEDDNTLTRSITDLGGG